MQNNLDVIIGLSRGLLQACNVEYHPRSEERAPIEGRLSGMHRCCIINVTGVVAYGSPEPAVKYPIDDFLQ